MMRTRTAIAVTATGTAITAVDALAAAMLHDTMIMVAALPVLALWIAGLAYHVRRQADYAGGSRSD